MDKRHKQYKCLINMKLGIGCNKVKWKLLYAVVYQSVCQNLS